MKNLRKKEGITLIALIITIIVLLILSAVGINLLLGENGIIEKTKEASFKTRFRQVEESVQIYKVNKEAESMIAEIVMSNVDQLPVANKLSNSDKAGLKNTLKKEIQEISGTEDILLLNLYYIDKKKINTKYEYIINVDTMQLYDVKGENIMEKCIIH